MSKKRNSGTLDEDGWRQLSNLRLVIKSDNSAPPLHLPSSRFNPHFIHCIRKTVHPPDILPKKNRIGAILLKFTWNSTDCWDSSPILIELSALNSSGHLILRWYRFRAHLPLNYIHSRRNQIWHRLLISTVINNVNQRVKLIGDVDDTSSNRQRRYLH